jgi:hypothetical protein
MDATKFNDMLSGVKDMTDDQISRLMGEMSKNKKVFLVSYYTKSDLEEMEEVTITDKQWGNLLERTDKNCEMNDIGDDTYNLVANTLIDMGIKEVEDN